MVDLHAHILPGLDDGAQEMEEALDMARIAVASGVRHMAATSHGNLYPYTLEAYERAFARLTRLLDVRRIPLKLYPAMEIFLDDRGLDRLLTGELLTINHTDYALVEFDFSESAEAMRARLERLRASGFRPVVAHPERYTCVQEDPEFAFLLARSGYVLQINQGSAVGDFGERCRKAALVLLDGGAVSLIATDTHDTRRRKPSFEKLLRFMDGRYAEESQHIWLSENPSRILKGKPVVTGDYQRR